MGNQYIDGVHDFNTTTFDGNPSPLRTDANTATGYVNSVPDENTTYFKGDTSALLAKIAEARRQVSALLAFNAGALGNADLGGPRAAGGLFGFAAGSILNKGARLVVAGEDGPEAIVPLRRSLARVDPSVRALSAYAQGMTPGGGITIAEGAIQVTVPNANPRNVAESVLDRLVARLN